jgi:hypothetical protein
MRLAMRPEIRALGWMTDGTPLYPIFGADPEPTEKEGEGKEGESGGSEGEGASGGTGAGDPAAQQAAAVVSLEEFETLKRRLAAADTAKGQAEKRLREIDDANTSELEKAKRDLEELTKRAEAAEAAALRAKLDREILKFPGFIWHDPETVLALVDMEMISVDENTGKVEGVKAALEKLAKAKPFLLKGKSPDNKGGNSGGSNGPSGQNPAGGDTTDKNKRRADLAQKYKLR